MIHVLFCIDDAFWQHLGVAISTLAETNGANELLITVVSVNTVSESNAARLRSSLGPKHSIEFIRHSVNRAFEELPITHASTAMYLRLFVTEYIDLELAKIIYFDSDIVICSDIDELWRMPFADTYIAAAREPNCDRQRALLDLGPEDPYINSGVMLINLNKWREDAVISKFALFASSNRQRIRFSPDQDIINGVFRGCITELSAEWNWQACFAHYSPKTLGIDNETFARVKRSPRLVHFTSKPKPWLYRWEPHYKNLYQEALTKTKWADYREPDRTLANVPIHILRKAKRFIAWNYPFVARFGSRLVHFVRSFIKKATAL